MTDESLRQLLGRVHERLSSPSTLDPESREMLATVMRDINGALASGSDSLTTAPVSPEARVADHASRIEELAVRFESDHPAVAQLLRQLGALLGQAGI